MKSCTLTYFKSRIEYSVGIKVLALFMSEPGSMFGSVYGPAKLPGMISKDRSMSKPEHHQGWLKSKQTKSIMERVLNRELQISIIWGDHN